MPQTMIMVLLLDDTPSYIYLFNLYYPSINSSRNGSTRIFHEKLNRL